MGNENPTKKAEICGERIRFIGLHCIASVSVCASLTMMECIYTCHPCQLCDRPTGCTTSHIDSSHSDGVVTLPSQSCDSVAGGTAGNRGPASRALSL